MVDEKRFVVEMNEYEYAAKDPEAHIHAENVMGKPRSNTHLQFNLLGCMGWNTQQQGF